MAESIEATERKLKRLGERVRAGWSKLHAAKQEHRDAVQRALLQQQKQQESGQAQEIAKTEIVKSKVEKPKAEEAQQKQKPRHRHGH